MVQNPYEVLGVSRIADMDEIKRAYRKKAKEYHPDLHPDDPSANEMMQQVNEAYDMLCNPGKYASRPQADAGRGNPYAGYGQRTYDDYARRTQTYRQGKWQYNYYSTAGNRENWQAWQDMWNQSSNRQTKRQSVPIFNPFRGVFRVLGGIMLFRFVMSLMRVLLFGFFR